MKAQNTFWTDDDVVEFLAEENRRLAAEHLGHFEASKSSLRRGDGGTKGGWRRYLRIFLGNLL